MSANPQAKRRVSGMVNDWHEHDGWFAEGCGCPWQETEFATWAEAMRHALTCGQAAS